MDMLGGLEESTSEVIKGFLHRVKGIPAAREDAVLDDFMKCLGDMMIIMKIPPPAARKEHLHRHAVHGQSAGFIHAKHGCGPERLDGRHATSEHPLPRNSPGAHG